jgi:hypothetical protein
MESEGFEDGGVTMVILIVLPVVAAILWTLIMGRP